MKKENWEVKVMKILVYVVLTIGILGVLLIDIPWKKGVYLIVVVLMLDILYKEYYNNIMKKRGVRFK